VEFSNSAAVERTNVTTQRRFDAVRRLKNSVPWDGPLSDVPTIAARVLDAPVSLLTLLDETCLRVVCQHGVDLAELPLEPGLCQSCMEEDAILILEDASRNDRARSNSLVAGSVGVRCYVGVPIRVEGCAVGALCVLDRMPRVVSPQDVAALERLAKLVAAQLELHTSVDTMEASLAAELVQRELREEHVLGLRRELAHRSKNMLAVVQSIVRQTTKDSHDHDLRALLQRIEGLGRTHDLIVGVEWQGIPIADLVERHLGPFLANPSQLTMSGPEIALRPSAAQHLGLALHELATNAIKYGALSVSGGRVELAWSIAAAELDSSLHITWVEKAGPQVGARSQRGFGCLVLERVTPQSLDGEAQLNFDTLGLAWHMTCPAENAILVSAQTAR
jgi:two-component sensor histidine kinase